MKRYLILIYLGCICFSIDNGQVLGLKGGLSFAQGKYVIYEVESSSGSLFGINTGILGEVPVSDALSLGTGVSFIKKGLKTEVFDLPVRYIEFPVNLTYRIDFTSWNLYAQAGPYAAVGISAKKKSNITDKIKFGSLEIGRASCRERV